jgi:hypothetical protein
VTLPNNELRKCKNLLDSIQAPADALYTTRYLALTAADKSQARENKLRVMINTLAKRCFLMGVNQAIKTMLMQKRPGMLNEAIQEAMSLELIN